MKSLIRFNLFYGAAFVILLLVEIYIALAVRDNFVRPYLGDTLVVILIYCFFKSFLVLPIVKSAFFVLLFAYWVEIMQYLNIVEHLHLAQNEIARIMIGTSFAWFDMLAYTAGFVCIIVIERYVLNHLPEPPQP